MAFGQKYNASGVTVRFLQRIADSTNARYAVN
jgi:hypothetical protein